jgi:hypothetical protein
MPGEALSPEEMGVIGGGTPNPAPSGTPSGEPVVPAGEMEVAKANVSIAMNLMTKQLQIFGADTEEGQVLLKALTMLSKKFSGKKSEDLPPAELMQLMGGQPDAMKQAIMKEMSGGGGPQQVGPGLSGPGPQAPADVKFAQ